VRLSISILSIAVALFMAAPAVAGTVIDCYVRALDPSSDAGDLTLYIEADRVRVEFENDDQRQIMIYDSGGEPVLYLIDDFASTYREVSPKDLKEFREEMEEQLSSLEDQMRGVPREAREAWQAEAKHDLIRMSDIANPRTDGKYDYKMQDGEVTVRKWLATPYDAYYDGQLDSRYAVAAWDDVDMSADDISILIELHDRYGTIAGNFDFVTMWSVADVSGFPVRMTSIDSGERMDITEIRDVSRADIDPYLFELPGGLAQQELFMEASSSGDSAMHFFGGSTSRVYATPTAVEFCNKPTHNQN